MRTDTASEIAAGKVAAQQDCARREDIPALTDHVEHLINTLRYDLSTYTAARLLACTYELSRRTIGTNDKTLQEGELI